VISMRKPAPKEIARALDLSASTVSRALNGDFRVSKNVDRVARKARELGYVPNAIARSLKRRATRMIGVIIPNVGSGYIKNLL